MSIRVIILAAAPWTLNPRETDRKYGYILPVLTAPKPKCLLHHNGKTILTNQIEVLNRNGLTDIKVMVNYRAEEIRMHLEDKKLKADTLYSKNYKHPSNSIKLGAEGAEGDIIVLYGDVWISDENVQFLLNTKKTHASLWTPNREGMQMAVINGFRINKGHLEEFLDRYRQMYPEDEQIYMLAEAFKTYNGQDALIDPNMIDFDVYEWSEDYAQEFCKNKTIGFAFMVADLFHFGHLMFLKKCIEECDVLVVGIFTDELTQTYKNKPIIQEAHRMAIIKELEMVHIVIRIDDRTCIPELKNLRSIGWNITKVFHGDDRTPESDPFMKETADYIKAVGGELVLLPYHKGISSRKIIRHIVGHYELKQIE